MLVVQKELLQRYFGLSTCNSYAKWDIIGSVIATTARGLSGLGGGSIGGGSSG
jgi:hypothetical protein